MLLYSSGRHFLFFSKKQNPPIVTWEMLSFLPVWNTSSFPPTPAASRLINALIDLLQWCCVMKPWLAFRSKDNTWQLLPQCTKYLALSRGCQIMQHNTLQDKQEDCRRPHTHTSWIIIQDTSLICLCVRILLCILLWPLAHIQPKRVYKLGPTEASYWVNTNIEH